MLRCRAGNSSKLRIKNKEIIRTRTKDVESVTKKKTYNNLNVVLVANNAGFCAERNNIVTGITSPDHVVPNISISSVADPVPGKSPARSAPNLVRAEFL